MYQFSSKLFPQNTMLNEYSTEVIKNEPMLFSCNRDWAYRLGGPITIDFLGKLDSIWRDNDYIVDSRVHMSFREGIYLAIPGFHLDDVPRSLSNGQPDHTYSEYFAQHCMALVNADIAPTEFAIGRCFLPEVKEGEVYYQKWHPIIEKYIEWGQLSSVETNDRQLYLFDASAFHQGTPTQKTGWRFFIRASRNTNRKPTNELRKQVQVYLEHPFCGW